MLKSDFARSISRLVSGQNIPKYQPKSDCLMKYLIFLVEFQTWMTSFHFVIIQVSYSKPFISFRHWKLFLVISFLPGWILNMNDKFSPSLSSRWPAITFLWFPNVRTDSAGSISRLGYFIIKVVWSQCVTFNLPACVGFQERKLKIVHALHVWCVQPKNDFTL